MSKYDGLIIPRSYNDYFSRSDPAAIRKVVEVATDAELDATSTAPIQNKAVAELVPAAASTTNQLADKQFVNSTVGTNTAIFRGTFNSLAELEAYSGDKTNNDYAFVIATDTAGNTQYKRYKYNGSAWEYEYTLNNSSFTATQWAAIQSGITSELVAKIGDAGIVPITTGDYNELPEAEKNADKLYLLTDATNGFVAITDTVAAGSTAVPTSDAVNTAITNDPEIISNANGKAYKFKSGLLICTKDVATTPTFTAWGNIYSSGSIDLGNWAATFIEAPTVTALNTSISGIYDAMINGIRGISTTKSGLVSMSCATIPPTGQAFTISVTGIGRWK